MCRTQPGVGRAASDLRVWIGHDPGWCWPLGGLITPIPLAAISPVASLSRQPVCLEAEGHLRGGASTAPGGDQPHLLGALAVTWPRFLEGPDP